MTAALLLLAASAVFGYLHLVTLPAPVGCGTVITTNTTLGGNIGPCSGDGLVIGANGVVLNCAGHSINGTAPNAGINITGITGVRVENCKVTGFQFGFVLYSASGNTLSNDTANYNSWYGFVLYSASGNTLSNDTANHNEQYGFYLLYSPSNTLSRNTANSNHYDGFFLEEDATSKNTLTGNTANSNADFGYFDSTTDSGNEGTANFYSGDECSSNRLGGSSPSGLGSPQL